MTRLISFLFVVLLSVPTFAAADSAAAQPQAAQAFLEKKQSSVQQVLKRPDSPARRKQLTAAVGDLLDYEELAKRALDRQWKERSKAERDQFLSLLTQLVERQYQRNMETTLDFDIRYTGAEPIDEAGALVKTMARSKKKKRAPELSIDYALHKPGDTWRVYDIWTDGVSLVKNYRRQFRRIIRNEGWNGLIERMEKKLNTKDELL